MGIFKYVFSFFLIALLGVGLVSNGQDPTQEKADHIKAQKIAFFTEKLSLTPEEAQRFWPVYNLYWEKKNKIILERRETMAYCEKNLSRMSTKEIKAIADKYVGYQKQEAELLIEFNGRFQKILPVEKVMKLYIADNEFKNWLLQRIKGSGKD